MGTEPIGVTVLTGILGAGKTTLVNRLLAAPGGRTIAVVVNDLGELNVDAELLGAASPEAGILELSNGCICCGLQDDLAATVQQLVTETTVDHIVVEASGVAEPVPIAHTLADESIAQVRLASMVGVIDGVGLVQEADPDRSRQLRAASGRPLAALLVEQIELCDLLILNKTDLLTAQERGVARGVIDQLQPGATVHETAHAAVDPEVVLASDGFELATAMRAAGWRRMLRGEHGSAHGDAAAAVQTHLFETMRPFDPTALAAWVDAPEPPLLRAKGFLRLAGRPETVMGLNQAGPAVEVGPIGTWGRDETPQSRIVCMGTDLDPAAVDAALEACLLADGVDPATLSDPFPR